MDGIVKNLSFGDEAKQKVFKGIDKLTKAVSSTLGASGKCVIMEDNSGVPIITKDGVTVANSVILRDPVENMGATLLKEAARKTVREAGDGTTTATVLAHSIMNSAKSSDRKVRDGISSGVDKVIDYLKSISIPVKGKMIDDIATISTNNDKELGKLIADAFRSVGQTGVVTMEPSEGGLTEVEIVEGVEYEKGFSHGEFITDKDKGTAELDNALVLLMDSKIDSIRQIQPVLEHVIKGNKALLIIGEVEAGVLSALVMNKKKGNIKINVIEPPAFGLRRKEIFNDLSLLTGATIINEDLGDDLNTIQVNYLGKCVKSTSTQDETIIQIDDVSEEVDDIIEKIKKDLKKKNKAHIQIGLEKRLARLSAKVAIVKIGANSDIELKEKSDRVEDAICATKAAIKEGIVPGGGIALLNASSILKPENKGEEVLLEAIKAPFNTLLSNAGIVLTSEQLKNLHSNEGKGLDVVTGNMVNMVKLGIIDPLLVTKSALINAASVATTILSTDCVINNMRIDEGNR
jgi:chaperonin GroEL